MSNAKTGFWSAVGALAGGAAGAALGHYAATSRPRVKYMSGISGDQVEDAMTVGGAAGAVVGAFVFATVAGQEDPPPVLPVASQAR